MASPSSATGSGRRRAGTKFTAEDQALNQIAREAEMRLAARRAARAEAREIRMKELEKQQKDAEEKQDRHYELTKTDRTPANVRTYNLNSRRGSDDSGDGDTREIRKELAELEEKWKKAMMNNAQLDNEKQTYRYQVDLLKDTLEEMEEQLIELQREHKDRCRDLDAQKRNFKDLQVECSWLKEQLQQRDRLIEENGLVFISNENGDEDGQKSGQTDKSTSSEKCALVTPEAQQLLALAEGSLDDRLKKFAREKESLEEEVKKLKQQLEEEREKEALAEKYASPKPVRGTNGPDMQLLEVQMEAQRQVNDYKFKLKKAEQDITTLEGNVIRLESQVKRYKAAAENSEKVEEELKLEKRKLQRELRETQNQVEELQTSNHHLQKRLEKIKTTRNVLNKPYMYGKMIAYIDSLLDHEDHTYDSVRAVTDIEVRREEKKEKEKRDREREEREKERERREKREQREWERESRLKENQ